MVQCAAHICVHCAATSLTSVLKSSLVQFFALFGHNQTQTGCLIFQNWLDQTETENKTSSKWSFNQLQPVATSPLGDWSFYK